jgi:hypothetical protein
VVLFYFVKLSNLQFLEFFKLLIWGNLLREIYKIVFIGLGLCMLFVPICIQHFLLSLLPQMGFGLALTFASKVPVGVQESEIRMT